MILRLAATLAAMMVLAACDGSNNNKHIGNPPQYDFAPADQWLTDMVAEEPKIDGAGFIVVSRDWGVLHRESFGDHTPDMVYLLASVSKVPAVSLLLALASDPNLDFDIDVPIENYLPWDGAYPGVTTAQLLSNTSGIPGLIALLTGQAEAHKCQGELPGTDPDAANLQTCAKVIYETRLEGTVPPGTHFDYGGSQWTLAGGVAEVVGGDSWANLFHKYIAEPCGLDVFQYGNVLTTAATWTGNPDDLTGQANPSIEGGAIATLDDEAKILQMQLNDGVCGKHRVMDASLAQRMRVDVGTALGSREWIGSDGRGYGMGWWVPPPPEGEEPSFFIDNGAYGSVTWIDTARGYGVFVAIAAYESIGGANSVRKRIEDELAPIMEQVIDNPL